MNAFLARLVRVGDVVRPCLKQAPERLTGLPLPIYPAMPEELRAAELQRRSAQYNNLEA